MKKIILSVLMIFAVLGFSFISPIVKAQTSDDTKGFSVSPPSFELDVNPGDVITNTIKVENLSDIDLEITANVQSFVAYGEEGQINLTEDDSEYSITNWITFEDDVFQVPANQVVNVPFTINVPDVAEPGSHYGAVVFSSNSVSTEPNTPNIVQEIGSIVLLRVPGDVEESATVVEFKSDKPYYTDPKVMIHTLLENTGNVIVKPTGSIVILDLFGNEVQRIELTSNNILPGSKRSFDQEFDFDKIGFFKAKLDLKYGDDKTLTAETSFTALYTQKTVPIILLIVAIILIYIIFRKRINRAARVIVKGESAPAKPENTPTPVA